MLLSRRPSLEDHKFHNNLSKGRYSDSQISENKVFALQMISLAFPILSPMCKHKSPRPVTEGKEAVYEVNISDYSGGAVLVFHQTSLLSG